VETSPLDRIQQRRAVLLSILDGHRLPRGPRLPLRGKGDSATDTVCRFLASSRAEMCALSARSRCASRIDKMHAAPQKGVWILWWVAGARVATTRRAAERSASQLPTASEHDQLWTPR
jgi:hypothetical protein